LKKAEPITDITMDILVPAFMRMKYKEARQDFDQIVQNTREIVGPGRNNPQNIKPMNIYSMNYNRIDMISSTEVSTSGIIFLFDGFSGC
jgi:hypothetical protein